MSSILSTVVAQVGPRFGPAFERGGDHPWRWVIGLAMLAIAIAAIAVAVVALVRVNRANTPATSSAPTDTPAATATSARALLDDRLARGDIDPADYEARRALLEGPAPGA